MDCRAGGIPGRSRGARRRRHGANVRPRGATVLHPVRLCGRKPGLTTHLRPTVSTGINVLKLEATALEVRRPRPTSPSERSSRAAVAPPGWDGVADAAEARCRGQRDRDRSCSQPAGTGIRLGSDAPHRGVSRRGGRGAVGRSETLYGAFRRSRARCRQSCPVPCGGRDRAAGGNSVGLSVGRSISRVSTSGRSMPSLKRSTVNTTRTVAGSEVTERRAPLVSIGSRRIARLTAGRAR